MKSIGVALSLVLWFAAAAPLMAADRPLVLADGNGTVLIGTVFAVEQGQDEIEALAQAAGIMVFGLLLLFPAYRTAKSGSEPREQNKLKGYAKILPAVLAVLGIGLIVGGILYGQTRLKQIDEKYATKRGKPK